MVRNNLAIQQYNPDYVEQRLRPTPDACRYISISDLVALGKKTDVVKEAETFMRENRQALEAEMIKRTTWPTSLKFLRMFEGNVVRMILARSLHKEFGEPGVVGKFEGANFPLLLTIIINIAINTTMIKYTYSNI